MAQRRRARRSTASSSSLDQSFLRMDESLQRALRNVDESMARTSQLMADSRERYSQNLPSLLLSLFPTSPTTKAPTKKPKPKPAPKPPARTLWEFLEYELGADDSGNLPKAKPGAPKPAPAQPDLVEEEPVQLGDAVALVVTCLFAAGLRWLMAHL